MPWRTGNQWGSLSTGMMCYMLLVPLRKRAPLFWATCSLRSAQSGTPDSKELALSSLDTTRAWTAMAQAAAFRYRLILRSDRRWPRVTVHTASDLVDIGTHGQLGVQLNPQVPHALSAVNDSVTNSQWRSQLVRWQQPRLVNRDTILLYYYCYRCSTRPYFYTHTHTHTHTHTQPKAEGHVVKKRSNGFKTHFIRS